MRPLSVDRGRERSQPERTRALSLALTPLALGAMLTLGGCFGHDGEDTPMDTTAALQSKVQNIVVIYAENRAFDNLYGNFPGADGLSTMVGTAEATGLPARSADLVTVAQAWHW